MSTLTLKELSAPTGEVIKIAAGKTLDLKSQGTTTLPTGSVIQVVNAKTSTLVINTTNSFADTGLTASITPSSTSSKILVLINQNGITVSADNSANDMSISLFKASTEISLLSKELGYTGSALSQVLSTITTAYLDSPSTTSATAYKTRFRNTDGGAAGGSVRVQNTSCESTITLMEIQG